MQESLGYFSMISTAFETGGIWMYAILVAQIFSVTIIAERTIALFLLRGNSQKKFVERFEMNIKKGELDAVIDQASRISRTQAIGRVLLAGTQTAKNAGGREEIQSRMDEVLMEENSRLSTRIGFLAMLGNVGTLLGLLGTIVGLIQAFDSVANKNAIEKANLLTSGVSMAMNTTAYGLIMAIPALVMFAILQNRANQLSEDLNQGSLKAYNWLNYNYETVILKSVAGGKK